jgi:hypothetical protein
MVEFVKRKKAAAALFALLMLIVIVALILTSFVRGIGRNDLSRSILRDINGSFFVLYTDKGADRRYQYCRRVDTYDRDDLCRSELVESVLSDRALGCGVYAIFSEYSRNSFELSIFSDFRSRSLLNLVDGRLAPDEQEAVNELYPTADTGTYRIIRQELKTCADFNVISVSGEVR